MKYRNTIYFVGSVLLGLSIVNGLLTLEKHPNKIAVIEGCGLKHRHDLTSNETSCKYR